MTAFGRAGEIEVGIRKGAQTHNYAGYKKTRSHVVLKRFDFMAIDGVMGPHP